MYNLFAFDFFFFFVLFYSLSALRRWKLLIAFFASLFPQLIKRTETRGFRFLKRHFSTVLSFIFYFFRVEKEFNLCSENPVKIIFVVNLFSKQVRNSESKKIQFIRVMLFGCYFGAKLLFLKVYSLDKTAL